MDASEFEARKEAVLSECEVAPAIFEQVVPRLERFMEPFVASLGRRERVEHALSFVQGLLSDLSHKNVESIAYRFGQERLPLQNFVGTSEWDDGVLRDELARQIGRELGEPDGILVFDPSGFPKSGRESVGVATMVWSAREDRQLSGRRVLGIRVATRARAHRHASVSARGMDEGRGADEEGGRAEGNEVSHTAPTGLGVVGPAWCGAAASVDHGR